MFDPHPIEFDNVWSHAICKIKILGFYGHWSAM